MYYTYILVSARFKKSYVGSARDVGQRLSRHNAGNVKSSKAYAPYQLIHMEEFKTLKEARAQEAYYKSTSGRRAMKHLFRKKKVLF